MDNPLVPHHTPQRSSFFKKENSEVSFFKNDKSCSSNAQLAKKIVATSMTQR